MICTASMVFFFAESESILPVLNAAVSAERRLSLLVIVDPFIDINRRGRCSFCWLPVFARDHEPVVVLQSALYIVILIVIWYW